MTNSLTRHFPDVAWTDLQTRGLVVVPRFLSADEINRLLEPYYQEVKTGVNTLQVYMDSQSLADFYRERLHEIVEHVAAHTDIKLDMFTGATYYALERGVNFGWHQDHISYYATHDHYNYVNVWIPLRKPVRNQSGLSLLPWDALGQRVAPEVLGRMQGGGSRFALWLEGQTHVVDDDAGGTDVLPFNLNEVSFTPDLEAGDALVLRGDMFHQTQDVVHTERIAFSVRLIYSRSPVRRTQFAGLCLQKLKRMASDRYFYTAILDEFKATGLVELTARRAYEVGSSHDRGVIEAQQRQQDVSLAHFLDSLATVMLLDAPAVRITMQAFAAEIEAIAVSVRKVEVFVQNKADMGAAGTELVERGRGINGELKAALQDFASAVDHVDPSSVVAALDRLRLGYTPWEEWIAKVLFAPPPNAAASRGTVVN